MESSESKGSFGTIVLVLLLTLAFLVGTGLFGYIGYQFLTSNSGNQVAQNPEPTPTLIAIATMAPLPTSTPIPPTDVPATPTDVAALPTDEPATPTNTPSAPAGTPTDIAAAVSATPTSSSTPTPAPTKPPADHSGTLPQTGVGPLASLASVLLAGVVVGARCLRHRSC